MTTERQVTVDQAWDLLTEKQRRALVVQKAEKSASFKEQLIKRARKAAEGLYQRDWKEEAREAAHGTEGCNYSGEEQVYVSGLHACPLAPQPAKFPEQA